jgi:hypothetical protein
MCVVCAYVRMCLYTYACVCVRAFVYVCARVGSGMGNITHSGQINVSVWSELGSNSDQNVYLAIYASYTDTVGLNQ